jgi:hypothetical protein
MIQAPGELESVGTSHRRSTDRPGASSRSSTSLSLLVLVLRLDLNLTRGVLVFFLIARL